MSKQIIHPLVRSSFYKPNRLKLKFKKIQQGGVADQVIVEDNEWIKTTDGNILKLEDAPTHDDKILFKDNKFTRTSKNKGGVALSGVDSVLSATHENRNQNDKSYTWRDEEIKIKPQEAVELSKQLGFNIKKPKKSISPSKLLDLNIEAKDAMIGKLSKFKTGNTQQSANSIQANLAIANTLPTNEALYDSIFGLQEAQKSENISIAQQGYTRPSEYIYDPNKDYQDNRGSFLETEMQNGGKNINSQYNDLLRGQFGQTDYQNMMPMLNKFRNSPAGDSMRVSLAKSYILNGRPDIGYDNTGNPSFDLQTNKMSINSKKFASQYMPELAHAYQRNILGLTAEQDWAEIEKNNPRALVDQKYYDATEYDRKGSTEYQAHQEIHPALTKIYGYPSTENFNKIDSIANVPQHAKFIRGGKFQTGGKPNKEQQKIIKAQRKKLEKWKKEKNLIADISVNGYSDGSEYIDAPQLTIDSNNITMQNTGKPLMGISDTGDVQYLEPYSGDYQFDGNSVTEIPIAQRGIKTPEAISIGGKKLIYTGKKDSQGKPLYRSADNNEIYNYDGENFSKINESYDFGGEYQPNGIDYKSILGNKAKLATPVINNSPYGIGTVKPSSPSLTGTDRYGRPLASNPVIANPVQGAAPRPVTPKLSKFRPSTSQFVPSVEDTIQQMDNDLASRQSFLQDRERTPEELAAIAQIDTNIAKDTLPIKLTNGNGLNPSNPFKFRTRNPLQGLANNVALSQAFSPTALPYLPNIDIESSKIPLIDESGYIQQINDVFNPIKSNINVNSTTGQAYLANLAGQQARTTVETLNDINQKNQQISAQNSQSQVNAQNQELLAQEQARANYYNEYLQNTATRDAAINSATNAAATQFENQITRDKSLNATLYNTPFLEDNTSILDTLKGVRSIGINPTKFQSYQNTQKQDENLIDIDGVKFRVKDGKLIKAQTGLNKYMKKKLKY